MKHLPKKAIARFLAVLGFMLIGFFPFYARASHVHVVAPGEQLGRLAFLYEVSEANILAANPLLEGPLEAGQRVVIPTDSMPEKLAAQAPPKTTAPAPTPVPATTPSSALSTPENPISPPAKNALPQSVASLSALGLRYNARWTPPGERSSWVMDCSNTVRWLLQNSRGIEAPRTASAQYDWLRKQKKLRRVRANSSALRKVLKPGDLLFWEHTMRPARKPPVTHVMVYLGTNAKGEMQMFGAQGSRGVSTYTFRPESKMGGYPFFLWFRRDGRFVAYGRP